ncbi:HAD family hydrolase [bacterium SCSIO 12696]|nr:HAD family hydrolase [bacterium SCSIO 12696]
MFDIDGTLIESMDFDSACYLEAVESVTGLKIDSDWSNYRHVTDSGILLEVIERYSLASRKQQIMAETKQLFIEKVASYINQNGVDRISGSAEFIDELKGNPKVVTAFATGGWRETAQLKLRSAGIEFSGSVLSSSSEHSQRTEIMKFAERNSTGNRYSSITYFGDGDWDKVASQQLGYQFIRIGKVIDGETCFKDFSDSKAILSAIGVSS